MNAATTLAALAAEMIPLPGGEFFMGSTREEVERCVSFWAPRLVDDSFLTSFRSWIEKEFPAHAARLAPFSIAKYPVTNAQYEIYRNETGAAVPESISAGLPGDHPVWGVGFDEGRAYACWLGAVLGRGCRLPSEAEWEFAARGPERREYPYGDVFDAERANTIESGIGTTTPVNRYERWPSGWGVCDLAGNVEEWVDGRYAPYPGGLSIEDDLTARLGVRYRILRGGSFARGGDLVRCARRHGPFPSPEYRYTGFRIVYDAS